MNLPAPASRKAMVYFADSIDSEFPLTTTLGQRIGMTRMCSDRTAGSAVRPDVRIGGMTPAAAPASRRARDRQPVRLARCAYPGSNFAHLKSASATAGMPYRGEPTRVPALRHSTAGIALS